MGISPLDFIIKVRVSKAKEILAEGGNFKLSAIAYMAGFTSTDQMNKAFRKIYGKNAREFKAAN